MPLRGAPQNVLVLKPAQLPGGIDLLHKSCEVFIEKRVARLNG